MVSMWIPGIVTLFAFIYLFLRANKASVKVLGYNDKTIAIFLIIFSWAVWAVTTLFAALLNSIWLWILIIVAIALLLLNARRSSMSPSKPRASKPTVRRKK